MPTSPVIYTYNIIYILYGDIATLYKPKPTYILYLLYVFIFASRLIVAKCYWLDSPLNYSMILNCKLFYSPLYSPSLNLLRYITTIDIIAP